MNRKKKQRGQAVMPGIVVVLALVIIASIVTIVVKKSTPSKVVKPLEEYYEVAENEIRIFFMQNEMYEKNGLYIDGTAYVDYEMVTSYFNKRFYWDGNENILIYTTPTEVIKADVGSKDYYVNRSKTSLDYQIVKTIGDDVYIALDYVKLHSNIEYEIYENPNRVVITCGWGKEYLYNTVKKATQVRIKPSIKSEILKELKVGDKLIYVNTEEEIAKGFCKVMTQDGVIGYVKEKRLGESYYEVLKNDYQEEAYSHITKDYTINMVWHQVTNMDANKSILDKLSTTKGVNTISPTWFSVTSNEGEISSLASSEYVESAKSVGVEVWALCDDFSKEVNMYQLLSYTSRREKLINELIAQAIQYDLAGLNIDFEKITKDAGTHYIQFLRELSVKCRNNGIVLSVDSYVPSAYTEYYDRAEQGTIIDYVVVMAYDEHYAGSEESGSVSSIGFVKKAIEDILKEVPAEQVIIGIPFYTRLWTEVGIGDSVDVSAVACGMGEGMKYLTDHNVEPEWNEETGQYYGEYETAEGRHRIWLEEDKSIELKMKAISENKVAGVAGWKLGLEKESIWNVIIKYTN